MTSEKMTVDPSPLQEAFADQDKIFASAFTILQQSILQQSGGDRAFPAASVAITQSGNLLALKALGNSTYEESGDATARPYPYFPIRTETLFDLASLTKPIATTTAAMLLYERGLLDLETPLASLIPEFTQNQDKNQEKNKEQNKEKDSRRREVTLRMLLAHSSGLPAYEKLFLQARARNELLKAAFTVPLTSAPATRAEYSDIGFILLAIALERLADEPLDRFCQREIFAPLGMRNTTFNPPAELRAQIPPTADERIEDNSNKDRSSKDQSSKDQPTKNARSTFRNRIIQGEVQDENASVLGGVAGHAGLFSTAHDIARFANAMLRGGAPILRSETVALFTRREAAPAGTSRALGWDTPSAPSQSGKYFSPQSYGHLGYTGTSLWIDPSRELSITLLTNRTWPDCSNHAIKQVRPKFHDAIIEALRSPKL